MVLSFALSTVQTLDGENISLECVLVLDWKRERWTNTNTQIQKCKYTNTNTLMQIYKYKYTNANIQIQIRWILDWKRERWTFYLTNWVFKQGQAWIGNWDDNDFSEFDHYDHNDYIMLMLQHSAGEHLGQRGNNDDDESEFEHYDDDVDSAGEHLGQRGPTS